MRKLVTAGLAASFVLPLDTAIATDSSLIVDEIIVSATRRETSARDVGAGLSVVDASLIARSQVITDALADAPGVFLQQTTPGQGALIIRGLRGSSILHLVDGMRLNNAIFRNAPTQYFALVPTTAVKRVEAIRGTPTSLYGSDAVGGVAQVVTRMPEFDGHELQATGDLSAGLNNAENLRSLRATVDVGDSTVAGTVSAEYLRTANRDVGGGPRIGPSGYESKAARAALVISPDDSRRWLLDLHYLNQPSTPRVDELIAGFGQDTPDSEEFFFEPNRRLYVHARHERRDGALGLDWRIGLSWQRIDDDRRSRNFGADERQLESNRSDMAGFMLTATREFTRGNWLAGVEYYHDKVSSRRFEVDVTNGDTVPVTSRFPDGSTLSQSAVFVNARRALTGRTTLDGGLRLSTVATDLSSTSISQAAGIDTTDLSGDVGWQLELNNRWQVVANLGAGFRAPNIFDLGTLGNRPGNRFNVPNTDLDSERIVQVDLGVRRRRGGIRFEAFVFALNYDDRITSQSTGDTTPDGRDIVQSVNAADSEIWGVETEVIAELGTKTRIEASAQMTRGTQTVNDTGEAADRIPPLTGRVTLRHAPSDRLAAHVWLRFADNQDRLSDRDVRDPRIDPNGTPGWGELGARIDWLPDDRSTISFGVDNVLDKRYRTHGSGLDAPGRNVFATINYRW